MKPDLYQLLLEDKAYRDVFNITKKHEGYIVDIHPHLIDTRLIEILVYVKTEDDDIEEIAYKADIDVDYTKGFAGSYEDPPEPEEIEVIIDSIETVSIQSFHLVIEAIERINPHFFWELEDKALEAITREIY